jgi:hypothetical protein
VKLAAAAALTVLALAAPVHAAGPPQVATSWVTDVKATSANLRAEVNANGLSTTYRFEYVTQAAFEASGFSGAAKAPASGSALLGSGTTPLAVVQHLGGLAPQTTYRYRPVATNSAGTTNGPEHTLTTQETSPVFHLPDARGWEMVSPLDKAGGAIAAPEALFAGGDLQAAAAGGAVTYGSSSAFGEALGSPPVSQYVSRRGAAGWSTENVSPPLESGAYGDEPNGAPYRVFSADLSAALFFGGLPCRGGFEGCPALNPVLPGSGAPTGFMAYYLRDNATGSFASVLGAADLAHSATSHEGFEAFFVAASPDLANLVLSSCAELTADAIEVPAGPGRCDPAAQNLYLRSPSGLSLVNLLPGDAQGSPGAAIAAPLDAISQNGARVYWTKGGELYLWEGSHSSEVDPSAGSGEVFQAATTNGSVAFFTKAGHLHRFLAATETVTDLTPGGGVLGVLGASADGSYVYYQDAVGLEAWHEGVTTTLAPGSNAAAPSDYEPPTAGTAQVSADGAHLAFLSDAPLTDYDNADAESGVPDTELYLYGPPVGSGAPRLVCASCNPTGERPRGPSSIPGAEWNGSTAIYRPRALSADGARLIFDSSDELVVQDTNSRPDVYQWEANGKGECQRSPGCTHLLSSGRGAEGASFVDASEDGADAYFLTSESLVESDPGSIDLYDARVGGGFPEAREPIACLGDACQSLPSPPDDPTPTTLVGNSGNPPPAYLGPKQGRHRHPKHRKRHKAKGHRHRHGGRK